HSRRLRRARLRQEPSGGAGPPARRRPLRGHRPRPGLHRQGVLRLHARAGSRSARVRRAGDLPSHRRHLRPVPQSGRARAAPVIFVALLGAAAALGSSVTWAYASTRYAQASRDVGSQRVNLARATVVLPIYLVCTFALDGRAFFAGVTLGKSGWLLASVLCS